MSEWVLMRVRVAGPHFPVLGVGENCYAGVGDIIHVAPEDAIDLALNGLAEVYAPARGS